MPNFTQGDTRIVLTQDQVLAGQNNGSLVIDSQRTRPYRVLDRRKRRHVAPHD